MGWWQGVWFLCIEMTFGEVQSREVDSIPRCSPFSRLVIYQPRGEDSGWIVR